MLRTVHGSCRKGIETVLGCPVAGIWSVYGHNVASFSTFWDLLDYLIDLVQHIVTK